MGGAVPQAQETVEDKHNPGSINAISGLYVDRKKKPFACEEGEGLLSPGRYGSTVVSENASEQPSSKQAFYLGCFFSAVGVIGAPITLLNKTPGAEVFVIALTIGLSLSCISYFMMEKQERAELCSSPCCSK